jgi:hypothetical protein
MPNAQNKPKIDARRFAALLAGFDTGNGSEEEAIAKVRALRRMAEAAGMRVVDVMELPEVKQAIDDQMGPKRQESPELREALEQAAAMQEELTERTRNVRNLADSLKQERERSEAIKANLEISWSFDEFTGAFVVGIIVGALTVALGYFIGNYLLERSQTNGLGNGQGISAPGIYEDSQIHALPKHGAVHHRLHRGGTPARTP